MDYKSVTIFSCWLAVALIAIAYMFIFANKIGDIFFGLFLPIGVLLLIATATTVYVVSKS